MFKFQTTILPALGIVAVFILLFYLEHRRPLRRTVESRRIRTGRNLAVFGLSAATLQWLEVPLVRPLAQQVESHGWGLLHLVELPDWLRWTLAFLLLDYTLFVWHWLTHRVGFLWRFHVVHHADLDMDASTALRFHFGEMALSIPYRLAQVRLLGIDAAPLIIWQHVLVASILFHHSNISIPLRWERWLASAFVTPRMHGIHHSIVHNETDSNWSTIFSWWDRLHGTLRLNVPQQEITIGVPAYRQPWQVSLGRLLRLPFVRQTDTWQLPEGGEPQRRELPGKPDQLEP